MRLRSLGLLLLATATQAGAQYSITQPSITTCTGTLEDSGGAPNAYGNNENFTTTICPGTGGGAMALNFTLFQLNGTGGIPADVLTIYDGADANATLIGSFTGQSLQGLSISASTQNTTGCLTLTFTSNATGTGNFRISLSCAPPCIAPIAQMDLLDTLRLCQGQELLLNASASVAAPGRTIVEYHWSGPGIPPLDTGAPEDTMIMVGAGAHYLYLQVRDDLGCTSLPAGPVTILVASTPTFQTTAPAAACAPELITLTGQATATPLPTSGTTCLDTGEPIYLPDNLGEPMSFTIPVSTGQPGAVIADADQLGDICINIEHSFLGDLVFQLVCPNNQSVILHQQGGGGTFLGDANDTDNNQNPIPGTCWQYCFSATAYNGTMVQCASGGVTPNVIQASQGMALAPGTYTPVQPLSNLIGCPVDGNWTLIITDLWGIDNGYLCSWCTGFDTAPDSSLAGLSPTLTLNSPDSAYWSGTGVNNTGSTSTAQLDTAGNYPFQFTVLDSYGCTHDTTIQVLAIGPLVVDAGDDLMICADSAQLALSFPDASWMQCNHTLVLFDSFGDGWSAGSLLRVILGTDTTTYTLQTGFSDTIPLIVQGDIAITLDYVANGVYSGENRFVLYDAAGETVYDSGFGPTTGNKYSGTLTCGESSSIQWSPTQGLSDPTAYNPSLFTTTSGWYTATVIPANLPACAGTDSIWVEAGTTAMDLLWNGVDSTLCASVDTLSSYAWWYNGSLQITTSVPCLDHPTTGPWMVIGTGVSPCPYVSDQFQICPEITLAQDAGLIVATGAAGTWSWTLNGTSIAGSGPNVAVQGNGIYVASVITAEGCTITGQFVIDGPTTVEEQGATGGLLVQPNPGHGAFTIQAAGLRGPYATLQCTDMAGRTVYQEQVPLNGGELVHQLDLHLSPGAYVLHVRDEEGQRVARLVVQ